MKGYTVHQYAQLVRDALAHRQPVGIIMKLQGELRIVLVIGAVLLAGWITVVARSLHGTHYTQKAP